MAPILIVDDNPVNRLALEALVKPLVLSYVVVDGGARAVEACAQNEFALVLMDLMMPGVDGFEAARRIREREFGTGRHTPIIAVTALDLDGLRTRCIEAGIDDVIGKPLDRARMASEIEKWTHERVIPHQGEENIVPRLVDTFLSVTRTLLTELDSAISLHDKPQIRRAVHELKSASLAMRAAEMARLCSELEAAAHKDDAHEIVTVYAALALAFTRVKSSETKVKATAARAPAT